jgi:hypothetical protein
MGSHLKHNQLSCSAKSPRAPVVLQMHSNGRAHLPQYQCFRIGCQRHRFRGLLRATLGPRFGQARNSICADWPDRS